MAAATPAAVRNVHWQYDTTESSFGSPMHDIAPQSLQYVNAQLVAHGFTHGAGLKLDGLTGRDQEVVLKCLVNMLGQRMEDMKRVETISSKYRTLNYDHERLLTQQRQSQEAVADAQRTVESTKAKLETSQKTLSHEEELHRKTRDDFQKMKTSMQYLRSTTANELKRKEKEVEKLIERFGKVCNDQVKLGTIGSGMVCANLLSENQLPQDNHYLDVALQQSEAARLQLLKENDALRDTILACANALQSVHHTAMASLTDSQLDEPEMILSASLFGAPNGAHTQAMNAQNKLRQLFGNLRDALPKLAGLRDSKRRSQNNQELEQLRKTVAIYEARLKEAEDQSPTGNSSVELVSGAERHELANAIEKQRRNLAEERNKQMEAAIVLSRHKADLEAERIAFLEEKRTFQAQGLQSAVPSTSPVESKIPARPPNRSPPEPKTKQIAADSARPKRSISPLPGQSSTVPSQQASTKPRPLPSQAKPSKSSAPPTKSTTSSGRVQPTLSIKEQSRSTRPPSPLPVVFQDDLPEIPTSPIALSVQQLSPPRSTTPPLTEDDLLMPYERPGAEEEEEEDATVHALPRQHQIPSHLQTQKTPGRGIFPSKGDMAADFPKRHMYSPVVPSPLSKMITADLSESEGPDSPSASQNRRPAELALPLPALEPLPAMPISPPRMIMAAMTDEGLVDVDPEFEASGSEAEEQEGTDSDGEYNGELDESLSPLTKIMNMGASPALAPMISTGFEFPGLFGGGAGLTLTSGLGSGSGISLPPAPTFKKSSSIRPAVTTIAATKVTVSKDVKSTTTATRRAEPPKRTVLGDHSGDVVNRGGSRLSKESTSSRGSTGSLEEKSSGRTSGGSGSSSGSGGSKPTTRTGKPTSGTIALSSKTAITRRGVSSSSEKENAGKLVPSRKPSIPAMSSAPTLTRKPSSLAGGARNVVSKPSTLVSRKPSTAPSQPIRPPSRTAATTTTRTIRR